MNPARIPGHPPASASGATPAEPGEAPGPPQAAGRDARDVILFDGVCDLCNTGAAWARARDRRGRFEFLPYQGPEAARRYPGLDPGQLALEMHVVTAGGEVLRGVDAAARVLRGLSGWSWLGRALTSPALRWAARPAYRWVAGRRRGLFGARGGCRLAPP